MMEKEKMILHIISEDEWNKVKSEHFYYPESLKTEGFIHCATREQVLGSVEFLYKEKLNFKILYIDPEKVTPEIVCEDIYKSGGKFPHIYGALNLDAVMKVVDLRPNEKGVIELPFVS